MYALSAIDGRVFQGNANGFISNSTLNVYTPTGTLLNTFTTTIGANAVYKNVYTTMATAQNNFVKVTVYPNPVSETLYIKGAKNAHYTLFDLSGRSLKSGVYSNGITVSGMAKGMYIIRITENGKNTTEKIIIKYICKSIKIS